MKFLIILSSFLVLLDAACKHKQTTVTDAIHNDSAKTIIVDTVQKEKPPPPAGNTIGKVSHQYASKGCATVLIVNTEGGEELVLIPHIPLENKFDREGLELYFNYHPLKMPQPPGCEKGMPAEITDISLK